MHFLSNTVMLQYFACEKPYNLAKFGLIQVLCDLTIEIFGCAVCDLSSSPSNYKGYTNNNKIMMLHALIHCKSCHHADYVAFQSEGLQSIEQDHLYSRT